MLEPVSDGAYRDASLGLVRHIADADQAVSQRKGRMTDALWRLLPSELRLRIKELTDVPLPEEASFEVLTHVAEQRLLLVDALDEALALAPFLAVGVTGAEDGTPSPPPQDDQWGPIGTEQAMIALRETAERAAQSVDRDARVSTSGPRLTVRLTVEDVPLLWVIECGAALNTGKTIGPGITFLRARHLVEVNVPTELPRLHIRPQGIGDALLKLLALTRELTLGDKTFDDVCFVEGDEAFAPQLLTEVVRDKLVERMNCGDFRLSLDSGVAKVSWTCSGLTLIEPADFASSAAILVALRHAAANVKLLRDA
jgi:hypothetical protein